jgi:hypothetical protein
MIDSQIGYNIFLKDIADHGLILHVVPTDPYVHPAVSVSAILFIYDTATKKTYSIAFNHQDLKCPVSMDSVVKDFNNHNADKWAFDKKALIQTLPINGLYDTNLLVFLYHGKLIEQETHETVAHRFIKRNQHGFKAINRAIPLVKHLETFEKMVVEFLSLVKGCNRDNGYKKENEIIIETLAKLEAGGIYVNPNCFRKHFEAEIYDGNLVYSQYNIYTSTGRPSNHFQNVNYAALNKENGSRKCFVSRFGQNGKMVLIDYSAFHPRIISYLTDFHIPVDVDLYQYLAELYFGRKNISEYDLEEAKKITFRQLYGGVEEKYEHIKYFSNLKSFMYRNWHAFKQLGYVETPLFKRRITNQHLLDPNPPKLFNYILQATETEIGIPVLKDVMDYLKSKQTVPVLYTYDSVLFDFCKDDGSQTLMDIATIMKMGDKFPIKIYAGDSYNTVQQIYPQL